jgi:hypothetical protein
VAWESLVKPTQPDWVALESQARHAG